jgi:hypothetical protein
MKPFKQYILEKPETISYKIAGGRGEMSSLRGLVNPTSANEIMRFFEKTRQKKAKFLLTDDDSTVFVWDAYMAIHYGIGQPNGYGAKYMSGIIRYRRGRKLEVAVDTTPYTDGIAKLKKASRGFRELIDTTPDILTGLY